MNPFSNSVPALHPGRSTPWTRWLPVLLSLLAASGISAWAPIVVTDHSLYLPGETIIARFAGGPGNQLDWIGVYPSGVMPNGDPPSTLWFYVDGTRNGARGFTEGSVVFPGGLASPGDWKAFFLRNDGYSIMAEVAFSVVEAG